MAVGSYDANGIWNFGESDNIAPFSTTLNKLASSTSAGFTSDRARLATLEAGSLSGLVPIKPASIVVASGTASTTTVGMVNFSAATSISLSGVFPNTYENFLLIFDYETTVNAANAIRLRSGSTDDSSANYVVGRIYQDDNTGGFQNTGGQTSWGTTPTGAVRQFVAEMLITKPGILAPTGGRHIGVAAATKSSGAKMASQVGNHLHQTSAVFDGITLYPTAGTMTGKIQVFGIND